MSAQSSSEYLNELAHEVLDKLDAGAVVLMALVRDDDGDIALAVGSTGLPHAVKTVARAMPDLAKQLRDAADGTEGEVFRSGFLAGGTDPDAN